VIQQIDNLRNEIFNTDTDEDKIKEGIVLPILKDDTSGYFKEYNHTRRVMQLSKLVGSQLGITLENADVLNKAALVHSVGKMGVDEKSYNELMEIIKINNNGSILAPAQIIIGMLESEFTRELAGIAEAQLGDGEQEAIDALTERYRSYSQIVEVLFNHHSLVSEVLRERLGIHLSDDSVVKGLVMANGLSVRHAFDNPDHSVLSAILVATNIIDATQSLEKKDHYGIENFSLTDEKFGLVPVLDREREKGRITQDVYDLIYNLLFVQKNEDLLRLIVAARLGIENPGDVTAAQLESMKSEVDMALEDINKDEAETPIENVDPETADSAETETYSQEKVNEIFESFDPANPTDMLGFLDFYSTDRNVSPASMSIFKNEFFSDMHQKSPRSVIESLLPLGLPILSLSLLQTVLERANFIPRINPDTDVIVLDYDSFGFSNQSASLEAKRQILGALERLMLAYRDKNRSVNIVLFSDKEDSWKIGSEINDAINALYKKCSVDGEARVFGSRQLAATGEDKYSRLLLTLSATFDINRANVKVFSNKADVMDTAKAMGTIMADREGTVMDAITIFANIHPTGGINFVVKGTDGLTVSEVVRKKGEGFFSLLGEELSLGDQNRTPKLRMLDNRNLIDRAA